MSDSPTSGGPAPTTGDAPADRLRRIDGGDAVAVGAAVVAWAAAVLSRPALVVLFGASLAAVLEAVGRHRPGGRRRRIIVAGALGLALLVGLLTERSLAGLAPITEGEVSGLLTLVTDPERLHDGRLRFDGRFEGDRLWVEVRSPHAVEAIAHRFAGEQVLVLGERSAIEGRPGWMTARHLRARLEVTSVSGSVAPAFHAAAANRFRRVLTDGAVSLDDAQRSLLAGLTLGDDRAQRAEVTADFRAAGLTHLLAVSGQNVAFVLAVAGPFLRRLRLWPRFVVSTGVVASFAFVTRFEPSVTRAAVVAAVALWARTTARPSGGVRHLAIAVVALVLIDPLLTRSIGFQLSVAACAGVLVVAPRIVDRLPGPRWCREGLGVTIGAQLAVAPVLVPTFGPMPLAALPANVVAGPVAGALMVWGVSAGAVAGIVGGPVAAALHVPTAVGLSLLDRIASVGAELPLGTLDLRHLVVLALATGCWHLRTTVARLVSAALVALVVAIPATIPVAPGAAAAGWGATVWSDGPVAVVDLGVGARPTDVLDALRARSVRRVALVVVRSGRTELVAVVDAVAARHPVDAVLAPATSPVPGAVTPSPGTTVRVGDLRIVIDRVTPTLRARIGWTARR